ncbi:hypothetical protein SCHPADRAFT_205372 [Schizopora paradoxa]|uniref:HMG box domain-containing protein n=1 Tax=Schizopora paradoxa TaxID=27342 RepID=A0A0H2RXS7_9AGAM|nr:hypothetical protein SCHPADRAFT_205372 [Schizopora paradoxa]
MPREASAKSKTTRKAAGTKDGAAKGGRGKKDKNAPKRALSAYMFFSQDWRERIKTENPDAGFGEVGKLLGAKWKELDDSEKKPYIDQAARDKTRADAEKADYEVCQSSISSPIRHLMHFIFRKRALVAVVTARTTTSKLSSKSFPVSRRSSLSTTDYYLYQLDTDSELYPTNVATRTRHISPPLYPFLFHFTLLLPIDLSCCTKTPACSDAAGLYFCMYLFSYIIFCDV